MPKHFQIAISSHARVLPYTRILQRLAGVFGDVIAPERCMGCLAEGTWLCARCRERGVPAVLTCIGCQRPPQRMVRRGLAQGGRTCPRCREATALTGVVSAGSYSALLLRRGIHWLKFNGVRDCSVALVGLMAGRLLTIAPFPYLQREAVLVPIPLHRRRVRLRGFNQSADLAEALSQVTGIPVAHVLTRTRHTWTQTKLPNELRSENLTAAFSAVGVPEQRRWWLLVDDVTTTGATLTAAAKALQTVGAHEIWGVTVARG